jgi:putative nucleotidyltransferase with HDIG domain
MLNLKSDIMTHDLNQYVEWFNKYSQSFTRGTPQDLKNISIKRAHSLRVFQNAMKISASLEMDAELAQLTHLAALFHDVGRFLQYERFQTFDDRNSANHAALSVAVLREKDALALLTPEHRRLVLGAVFLHNRQFISQGLPWKLDLMTKIVRDADKLDIFPVLISHFSPDSPVNGVVTLGLQAHPTAYTESIFVKVQSREIGKYEEMAWINDLKLLLCSWVYDLNFPVSRKIVLEEGYIERIFRSLPENPKFIGLKEQLTEDLAVEKGSG